MSDFCTCTNCACNAAEIRSSLTKRNYFPGGVTIYDLWTLSQESNNSTGRRCPRSHIAGIDTILYGTVFSKTYDTAHPKLGSVLHYWKIPLVLAVFNCAIYRISAQSHSTVNIFVCIRERYIWNAIGNFAIYRNARNCSKKDILWIGHIQIALNCQTGNFSAVNLTEKSERRILCLSIVFGKIQIGNRIPVSIKFAAEAMLYFTVLIHRWSNRRPFDSRQIQVSCQFHHSIRFAVIIACIHRTGKLLQILHCSNDGSVTRCFVFCQCRGRQQGQAERQRKKQTCNTFFHGFLLLCGQLIRTSKIYRCTPQFEIILPPPVKKCQSKIRRFSAVSLFRFTFCITKQKDSPHCFLQYGLSLNCLNLFRYTVVTSVWQVPVTA